MTSDPGGRDHEVPPVPESPVAHWTPPQPEWPVPQGFQVPLPAAAPPPPGGGRHRWSIRRTLLVGALLSLVLSLIAGGLAWMQYSKGEEPVGVAEQFFSALADGDAPRALGLGDRPPLGPYLTNEVLARQLAVAGIEDVSGTLTNRHGARATVAVHYRLAFPSNPLPVDDSVDLVRIGSTWRLDTVATNALLIVNRAGRGRVTFAGRTVPPIAIAVFPGALPVRTDSSGVEIDGRPFATLKERDPTVRVNVRPSADATERARKGLDTALSGCLAATSSDPLCPLPDVARPIPGSLHGQLSRALSEAGVTIDLPVGGGGTFDITATVPIEANWQVWDFNNQAVRQQGMIILHLHARASIDAPDTLVWVAGP